MYIFGCYFISLESTVAKGCLVLVRIMGEDGQKSMTYGYLQTTKAQPATVLCLN